MKYNSFTAQIALFFILLLFCVKCTTKFKQYAFSHYLNDIDKRMKTYRADYDKYKTQLENFSNEDCETSSQDSEINNSEECKNKQLRIENLKNNLPNAATVIEKFDSYYKDLIKDFWRMFKISQANKHSLYSRDNVRKKIGYKLMEKLMQSFMNPTKIRGILKAYMKLLNAKIDDSKKTRRKKLFFLEKPKYYIFKDTRLKIWSSFRLEEVIHNEQLFVKGENVAKTCISNFLSNMQPSFCWKEFHLLGHPGGECPKNYTHILGACLQNCQEGYSFSGGICLKKCQAGEIDCGAFCGLESCQSSTMTAKESHVPDFKSIKDEDIKCSSKGYKDNLLCIRDCKYIGLENCDLGTCASTKEFCKGNLPKTTQEFDKYFVNYLGYIFSLRSNRKFEHGDPKSFNETLQQLVNYSEKNYDRIRQTSRIMQKLKNDKDLNYWFFRTIKYNMLHGHATYPDRERWKMVDICRKVAANWLDMADTNSDPFDFNSLKQPFELMNWKVCESYDRKDVSQCVKQITDLIKRIGANDLPGITAEYLRPSCRLYL